MARAIWLVAAWLTLSAGQAVSEPGTNAIQRQAAANAQHVTAAPSAQYRSPNEAECEGPKSAEQENLCLQRRATEAAEGQAAQARIANHWSHHQALLDALQAGGLAVSVILTGWAALEAGRAARAAARSNKLTEEGMTILERAYAYGAIDVYPLETMSQESAKLMIIVMNKGKTPARVREVHIGVFPELGQGLLGHPTTPDYSGATKLDTDTVFGAGEGGTIMDFGNAPLSGIAYGMVIYDDVFGARHTSRFFMSYNAVTRAGGTIANEAWNECD